LAIPRTSIEVVPSGVDTDRFNPTGRAAPRGRRFRILSVGRFVDRKGYDDVIRALPAVPKAEFVLVGGPPAAGLDTDPLAIRLRALARECGVANRVRLVGSVPREEMPRWYRSANVVAASPWYEPFSLTPLEAMACGVPVVATAVGGLIETVVDGLTGDLVPPRDPQALGAALRKLAADRPRCLAYAAAAVDRVRAKYSWQRCADRLTEIYAALTAPLRKAAA
jgi:glycosyltransferase involved in cell wall biosynthesis